MADPIDFDLKFNPDTGLFRIRPTGVAPWSEPMGIARLTKWIQTETAPPVPVEDWGKRRDNMPLAHAVKGKAGPTAGQSIQTLSEIYTRPDGTKAVRRIPASAVERQEQQMNELLGLLEGEGL
jgi:hypothetical protein